MLATAIRKLATGLAAALVLLQSAMAQAPGPAPILPSIELEQFLPVESRELAVGPFEAMRRPTGVVRPFFLIGCDAYSREWLRRNHRRLLELKAFGLVIEAPNAAAYRQLESLAVGLLLRPVAGDLIAEHLDLRRFPALITADGIFP